MAWLYQTPKFQENQTGQNLTNLLQSWPDVRHLNIWPARGKECPPHFIDCSQRRNPYILRRLAYRSSANQRRPGVLAVNKGDCTTGPDTTLRPFGEVRIACRTSQLSNWHPNTKVATSTDYLPLPTDTHNAQHIHFPKNSSACSFFTYFSL